MTPVRLFKHTTLKIIYPSIFYPIVHEGPPISEVGGLCMLELSLKQTFSRDSAMKEQCSLKI